MSFSSRLSMSRSLALSAPPASAFLPRARPRPRPLPRRFPEEPRPHLRPRSLPGASVSSLENWADTPIARTPRRVAAAAGPGSRASGPGRGGGEPVGGRAGCAGGCASGKRPSWPRPPGPAPPCFYKITGSSTQPQLGPGARTLSPVSRRSAFCVAMDLSALYEVSARRPAPWGPHAQLTALLKLGLSAIANSGPAPRRSSNEPLRRPPRPGSCLPSQGDSLEVKNGAGDSRARLTPDRVSLGDGKLEEFSQTRTVWRRKRPHTWLPPSSC